MLSSSCSCAWLVSRTPILEAVRAADALTLHDNTQLPNNSKARSTANMSSKRLHLEGKLLYILKFRAWSRKTKPQRARSSKNTNFENCKAPRLCQLNQQLWHNGFERGRRMLRSYRAAVKGNLQPNIICRAGRSPTGVQLTWTCLRPPLSLSFNLEHRWDK